MKLLWNGSRCYRLASQCVHSAHSLVRCDCLVGESGLIHLPVILLHSSLMCTPWQPWANAVGHVTNRLIPFLPFHLSLPPAGGLPHPSIITRSPYKSCGPICLDKACSNPSLCYLYYIDMWRGEGERGGEDCQIWWNDQQSLIRRDNTSLGSNKLYPNISVHNSCMGSLWCHNEPKCYSFLVSVKVYGGTAFPGPSSVASKHISSWTCIMRNTLKNHWNHFGTDWILFQLLL